MWMSILSRTDAVVARVNVNKKTLRSPFASGFSGVFFYLLTEIKCVDDSVFITAFIHFVLFIAV